MCLYENVLVFLFTACNPFFFFILDWKRVAFEKPRKRDYEPERREENERAALYHLLTTTTRKEPETEKN